MEQPDDLRKSLDAKDRPWNWSREKWVKHQEKCYELFGFMPEQPSKPDPDDEPMVLLNISSRLGGYGAGVKYVRDMLPVDRTRINAYLPSKNEIKKIYGLKPTNTTD